VRITNRNGKPAKRDIVQFVPMKDFFTKNCNNNAVNHRFNQAVLEEIPRQVVDFYANRRIVPSAFNS